MDPEAFSRYAERRQRVLDALGADAVMVLPAAPEIRPRPDLELRYRPDPDLFYLTGYAEPDAVAVLCPACDDGPFVLFVRPRDPEAELWTGVRGGVEAAREVYGADAAYPVSELEERLPKLVGGADTLYFRLGTGRDPVERLVRRALIHGRKGRQRSGTGPRALVDPGAILDDMRLIKDAHEIRQIRRAATITAQAFREAARRIRPGAGEWEVEAALEAGFRSRGAQGPAFESIVASGANATVLHYVENSRAMRAGELVLLDAGASVHGYAGDISRTFPVDGRFTPEQRALYQVVLEAKDRAIARVQPGAGVDDVHREAVRVLVAGMVEHGLLHGDPEELARDKDTYKAFFPHRTSHWLGLDVHDVGEYAPGGEERRLKAGMVLTVEPGLYVPPDHPDAPEALRGLGIRLEDDVLVTPEGHDVLTTELPADPDTMEALVSHGEAW